MREPLTEPSKMFAMSLLSYAFSVFDVSLKELIICKFSSILRQFQRTVILIMTIILTLVLLNPERSQEFLFSLRC